MPYKLQGIVLVNILAYIGRAGGFIGWAGFSGESNEFAKHWHKYPIALSHAAYLRVKTQRNGSFD